MSEILQHNFEEPNDNDHEKESEKESRIEYLQENEEEIVQELMASLDEMIGDGNSSEVLTDSQRGDICYKVLTKGGGHHVNTPEKEADFLESARNIKKRMPRGPGRNIKVPAPFMTISKVDIEDKNGEEQRISALAMERIRGATLFEIRTGGENPFPSGAEPRSMEDFKELRSKIFRGLRELIEEMNKEGIYHNDIRERNIMLDENGDCWLIDFGRAEEVDENRIRRSDIGDLEELLNPFWDFASNYVKNLQDE